MVSRIVRAMTEVAMAEQERTTEEDLKHHQQVHLGLGEAIRRLVHVEFRYRQGIHSVPEVLLEERELLTTALNQFELDLGFDCDDDGVPDTVEIFEASATTSCCRILPFDTSRRAVTVPPPDPSLSDEDLAGGEAEEEGGTAEDGPKKKGWVSRLFSRKADEEGEEE
jgi:hypothetical protein